MELMRKPKPGRPVKLVICARCRVELSTVAMRKHKCEDKGPGEKLYTKDKG